MLEWASPLWFLALPLAVLAPWFLGRPRLAAASLSQLRTGLTLRLLLARAWPAVASVGLVLLVVALARPQEVSRERVRESEGIDILLVLDTSESLATDDYTLGGRRATRLEAAKEVIARFVEGRPDDRIGLVVFDQAAFAQVPLTLDHEALLGFLEQVEPAMVAGRTTAIGDGLAIASQRLQELDAPDRVAILLTDGRNTAGQIEPLEAAEAAKALDITVYTIGIGSGQGGGGILGRIMGGRGNALDDRTLDAIARITGGRYFKAADSESLGQIYSAIDALEVSTAEVRELVDREERYHPWLRWGLALLLLHLGLGETLLRRLP